MKSEVSIEVLEAAQGRSRLPESVSPEALAQTYPANILQGSEFSLSADGPNYLIGERLNPKGPFVVHKAGELDKKLVLKMSPIGVCLPGQPLSSIHTRGMAEAYSLLKAARSDQLMSLDGFKLTVLPQLEEYKFISYGAARPGGKLRLGRFAFVMEHVEGMGFYDWWDLSESAQSITEQQALLMLSDVMLSMQYLQSLGIYHSDYAPKNLLVVESSASGLDRPMVRLIDPDCAQIPALNEKEQGEIEAKDVIEKEMQELLQNTFIVFSAMFKRAAGNDGRQFIRQMQWKMDPSRFDASTLRDCLEAIKDRLNFDSSTEVLA